MSGRGDDAFWRNEEAAQFVEQEEKNARLRRELEKIKARIRGLEPEKLPNLSRQEMMEDFFKPEDDVDSMATGFGPMRTENEPVTNCNELRGSVLKEAMDVINGQRQDSYGNPEDSFERIANLWDAYLTGKYKSEIDLTAEDVALMMTLMKIARMMTGSGHKDSYVDAAGYIGLAADMGAKCER